MITIFIDGGEYVDKKTYIQTRNENTRLREHAAERIAELEDVLESVEVVLAQWRKELRIDQGLNDQYSRGYCHGMDNCIYALEQALSSE